MHHEQKQLDALNNETPQKMYTGGGGYFSRRFLPQYNH